MNGKKDRNRMLMGMAVNIFACLIQAGISFFVSPFLIGKLGEEAYGFVSLATNFTEYLALVTITINSMSSRFISVEYNKGNLGEANCYFASVFWFNLLFSAIMLVATIFLISRLDQILVIDGSLVHDVKITFMITFVNSAISFLSTCYAAIPFTMNRMDINAYIQIFSKIVRALVIVSLYSLFTTRIYYIGCANIVSSVVFFLVLYIYMKKTISFDVGIKHASFPALVKISKSGLWILVSNISSIFLVGLDLLLADLILDQKAMARLAVSKEIPTAIGGVLGYCSSVFAAWFTKLVARNEKNELIRAVKFSLGLLGGVLATPFAGVIILGKDFLTLWLPENRYTDSDIKEIYILMILTLVNVIVNAFMYSIHALFIAMDKVKKYSVVILSASIISVLLTIYFAKNMKGGAYIIAGTSSVVMCVINLVWVPLYAEKVLKEKRFSVLRLIARNYCALGIVSAVLYFIRQNVVICDWNSFVCWGCFFSIIGFLLSAFVTMGRDERTLVYKKIKDFWIERL